MFKLFRGVKTPTLEQWNQLRYSTVTKKRQRIIALDILRGLFLVILMVDHFPWGPSLYSFVAGQGSLFASAAEGFFIVSGVLVGYIYGQKIVGSPRQTFKRIWKRGFILYIISVVGTLLYTLLALWFSPSVVGIEPWRGDLLSYILNTFSLRYSYGWTDFLNRYAVFMFAAPFALWLVSRRKTWVVITVSVLVWVVFRENAYLLPFSAWQLIFMLGLVLGYYLPEIEGRLLKTPHEILYRVLRWLVVISISTYALSVIWSVLVPYAFLHYGSSLPQSISETLSELILIRESIWQEWFSKEMLAPGRVLFVALWFSTLYILIRTYESKIIYWKLGKVVETLGKHSLFVYVVHGVVLVLANILLAPPIGYSNLLVSTVMMSLLLWIVYKATLHRDIFDRLLSRTRKRINREDF